MRRRLAVILMADMVEYSRLMEADQAGTIELVGELRERWLEPEAAMRGGEVLKRMGDGWIIAFNSVTDAVEAAQGIQEALSNHQKIKLRIAVHLGEIAEDGADLYGSGINITARLQTEAAPGALLVSEDLYRQLDEKLASGFQDVGSFELKNIAKPVNGYQWRPNNTIAPAFGDKLPTIAIEPIVTTADRIETKEAAIDLQDQLALRMSRRTGIQVLSLEQNIEDKANYLLRGRIRVNGPSARITLSLLLQESSQVLWSNAYEGPIDGIFDLVDQTAERVDGELRLVVNMSDAERTAQVPVDALSPSDLRARAANRFYAATFRSYEQALELLERSLRLAPNNPMSLAMWAHAHTWLLSAKFEKASPELLSQVSDNIDAAAQDAPRSDFVSKVRADVRLKLLGDIEGAKRACARTRQLNPDYSLLKMLEAEIALAEGNYLLADSLSDAYQIMHASDPDLPYMLYVGAIACLLAEKSDEARQKIENAIEIRPTCKRYRLLLAKIHKRNGDASLEQQSLDDAAGLGDDLDILAPNLVVPKAGIPIMECLRLSKPIST